MKIGLVVSLSNLDSAYFADRNSHETSLAPLAVILRCQAAQFLLMFDVKSVRTRRAGCLDGVRWHKRRIAKIFPARWNRIASFFERLAATNKHPATVTVSIVVGNAKHPAFRSARCEDLLKLIPGTNCHQSTGRGWWRLCEGCRP